MARSQDPSRQLDLIPGSSAASPRAAKLSELEPGEWGDCFAMLASRDPGKTRDGKPYYRVTFRDAARAATVMVWADSGWFEECESKWQAGAFYKLRCCYQETQYGPQLELERIRAVEESDKDDFDPASFTQSSRFDADAMFAELAGIAEKQISDVSLRQLVLEILQDHDAEIRKLPAAARHHHAFRGGFVEHVLSVTKTAVFLADKYCEYYPRMQPPLSKSLVAAGAILHDIGKLIELSAAPQGAQYTARGQLIGHILLGRDIVREKAAQLGNIDPEVLLRLEHIIVSHQNLPEWGSPIAPRTPEALLVYFADDIDAKFYMMAAALMASPQAGEEFTGRDNPLRRSIFRGFASPEANEGK